VGVRLYFLFFLLDLFSSKVMHCKPTLHLSANLYVPKSLEINFGLFQEKNCRKGRFSPSKLKGKRVIELGAGCGVAGFGEFLFL
jgi:hypothetical protein